MVAGDHEQIFAYTKNLDGETALVLMNFGNAEVALEGAGIEPPSSVDARLVLSNYVVVPGEQWPKALRGYEGRVYIWTTA